MKKIFVGIIMLLVAFAFISGPAYGEVGLNKSNVWKAKQHFRFGASFEGNDYQPSPQFSKIWYVCSVNGSDTLGNDYGKSYTKPFATINYAVDQCRAGYGDVIVLLPSHNEAVSTAGAIDLDIAGIYVIGMGTGDDKPTIDFDAQAGSVAIGADNVTVENIRFRVSANAVTVGLDIEDGASNAHVNRCEFGWAETAADEFAIALRTGDASNEALIENCIFNAGAQAAVTAIDFNKDTDHTIIRNNYITGTYSTAPIMGETTASTNLLIDGNKFYTGGSADTFNLVAASTGIVADNYIVMNAVSAAAAMDIGNCMSIQNFLIADDDVGGDNTAVEAGTFASVTATADD